MNSLKLKMEEASNLFQTHSFKKALQLYEQCISICLKNQEPKSLLHNLMSSKGALLSITGDNKAALKCLNEVLSEDPYHSLCLMRRSQVLKKKGKLTKALKDLQLLGRFSPDNMQIAALKVQIQNLRMKSKHLNSSSSQSEEESAKSEASSKDDLDEEAQLNFSNLKMIDRKSVSIMFPAKSAKSRQSRVTIAGDIAIEYEAVDNDDEKKSEAETNITKEYAKEKYVKTFREIELDDDEEEQKEVEQIPVPKIKPSTNLGRTKSILKNRDSAIYVNTENKQIEKAKKYGGRQSKMIDMLKSIDGKVIAGSCSMDGSRHSIKEVEFRKSMFGAPPIQIGEGGLLSVGTKSEKPKVRKSCMKRSSFDTSKLEVPIVGAQQPRRSKFEMMPQMGIDGAVIKKKKNQSSKENIPNDSNSDSDGSQHNIFGSNQVVLTKEMRQNLGIESEREVPKKEPKPRAGGGKSILKKNSLLKTSINKGKKGVGIQEEVEEAEVKTVKKAKKSVMFNRG